MLVNPINNSQNFQARIKINKENLMCIAEDTVLASVVAKELSQIALKENVLEPLKAVSKDKEFRPAMLAMVDTYPLFSGLNIRNEGIQNQDALSFYGGIATSAAGGSLLGTAVYNSISDTTQEDKENTDTDCKKLPS